MLPEITGKIRPPRALSVPWPLGFPLGAPNDPPLQRKVLMQLLGLLTKTDLPIVESFAR